MAEKRSLDPVDEDSEDLSKQSRVDVTEDYTGNANGVEGEQTTETGTQIVATGIDDVAQPAPRRRSRPRYWRHDNMTADEYRAMVQGYIDREREGKLPRVQYEPKVGDEVILRVKPFRPRGFDHDDAWTHDYDLWCIKESSINARVFLIDNVKTNKRRYEPDNNLVPAPPLLFSFQKLDGEFVYPGEPDGDDFMVESVLLDILEPMEDGVVERVRVEMTAGRYEKVRELSKPK
ncbi:uncharacterized protein AB675_2053 [Cyphellophora attinorum]|uniref:Uncharacterized protein n=1 Tax=Cyphellophora attinorum TaxID=1664694 RepID=A0A0N1HE52_9EURO|nr:uncharacterized protein AB675_2053 [Phialophora attinorum]KPI42975.1 hypothetical protein AB675_2053 [Phialophora attinorum]